MPWGSVCLAEPSPYSSQEASQQSTVFVLQQNIYLCPGCCFLEDLSLVIPFPPVSLSFFLHWLLIHAFIHSFLQSTVSPPPPHPQLSAQAALLMLHLAVSSSFAFTMPPPTTLHSHSISHDPSFPIHAMPILQCLALGLAMSPLIP